MDKNTFTGLFLMMIIIGASVYFMKPSEAELKKEQQIQDSIKNRTTTAVKTADTLAKTVKKVDSSVFTGPFGASLQGTESESVLENPDLKITISNKGARIKSVELKKEKNYSGNPVVLFNKEDNQLGIKLNITGKSIDTKDLYFDGVLTERTLNLRANYAEGRYVEFAYQLPAEGYNLKFDMNLVGLNGVIEGKKIDLNWQTALRQQEKSQKTEQERSAPYYKYVNESPDHLSMHKDEKEELDKGKIEWISFKQHFFSSVLIPTQAFDKASLEVKSLTQAGLIKQYDTQIELPFSQNANQQYGFNYYFGSNKFSNLKAQGHELEKQVDMGYWPLKYINRFIVLPIFNLLKGFNWGYGLIILVLTILLKLAMSPLTYKSYVSMAKMRVLKPEMDAIKAKVGEDNPTLLQQEYLKLYKQVGVNPLGGCLPMLLQLPFVMAFFFFFPNLFELRGESFLWMKDLSTYDDFIKFGFNIPFIGDHISLMCLLMTISTLIYTYFNNQISGATGQMKYIGYIMPIIFLGVLNSYPSGLNYYYFLANMLTFLQQYFIRKMVDDDKIHAILQENKTKPKTEKKKSAFQTRMEEYMRQQQNAAQSKNKK